MEIKKNYYTFEEVVAITGASEGTVSVWRRDKKIESYKNPENGRILVFDPDSFFKFLTKKANKRYFDCASAKSHLFHDGDFNKVISCLQSVIPGEKKPEHKKEQSKLFSPISTKADMKAFDTYITDLDKAISRIDNSIKHLTHLKTSYVAKKANLEATINDDNRELNERIIYKLSGAIRGVNNTMNILLDIKRGYVSNKNCLKSVISSDENIEY